MTSENCIYGEQMLSYMRSSYPDRKFKLSKKNAVNYQTSSGRWLACCIHGSQVSVCTKDGCGKGDFCGCIGERGAKLPRNRCATHGGASLCIHNNMKNVCKIEPCFGNQLCPTCTTQKSKCLCGTGGHICTCGCGKRRSLCEKAIAQKKSGELPARVTKEYLEEKQQNFQNEDERKKFYDKKALEEIYSKSRRDFDTGCLLYNARQPDPRGRILAQSKYDGEVAVYRIVYRIEVDPDLQIADWIEHACDNIDCVEKTHLSRKKRNDEGPEYFNRRYQEVLAAGVKDGECLLWPLYVTRDGYGRAKVNGDNVLVHRFSYMMSNNLTELPIGLHVRHSHSGKRNCYHPNHLSLGTAEENGQDAVDHRTTQVGEKNWNAAVTNDIAEEIYNSYGENVSAKSVAEKYNVSVSVVKGIWFCGSYYTATGDFEARNAQRDRERLKRKQNAYNILTASDYEDAVQRIKLRIDVDEGRGCWRVRNSRPREYPHIWVCGQRHLCHRIMFEACCNNKTVLDDDLYVLHKCEELDYDHYACCNPNHLKAGTAKENAIDRVLVDKETVETVKKVKIDLKSGVAPKIVAQSSGKSLSAVYKIQNGIYFSYISPDESDSDR